MAKVEKLMAKETDGALLGVIFLEGGVLFPNQTLPIPSMEGIRIEDVQSSEPGKFRVGVLARGTGPLFPGPNPFEPEAGIASIGTEATITGVTKLPNGQIGLVLKGRRRFKVLSIDFEGPRPMASIEWLPILEIKMQPETRASIRLIRTLVFDLIKSSPLASQESLTLVQSTDDPLVLANLLIPYLTLTMDERQELLEIVDPADLITRVTTLLIKEKELLDLSLSIHERVRGDMNDHMRRSFLKEQMHAIKRELGDLEGDRGEIGNLRQRSELGNFPAETFEAMQKELHRMEMMPPGSPEYMVSYNYVSWLLDIPWESKKDDREIDLIEAKKIMDKGHYGLFDVKERLLEYLAVKKHQAKESGQILLFVGPPGVGKTSLVKTLSEAMSRPFTRISLGGVHDEAEIRGHRRTYIGAMPGRIIQALKKVKQANAILLLDEIDKVGTSHRGDLSSALLEVLDPEQNRSFTDHYLGVPYDLSKVTFIATANSLESLSAPLLDRMEIINLSGYSEEEKLSIAKTHLIPSIREDFGLKTSQLRISLPILKLIIRYYTREAGVRFLKQVISSIARKQVRHLLDNKGEVRELTSENLSEWLGKPLVMADAPVQKLVPGVSIGLAYTPFGGDILYVETIRHPFKGGGLKLTGRLGDVMKESASAVLTWLGAHSDELGINLSEIEESKFHIHFPEGGIPKDGPSAGVALLCALTSLLLNKSMPTGLAMTGEITLRGDVLPVGGIKEKVLGAHRAGVYRIMLPAANWFDLDGLPESVLEKMSFVPLVRMSDALAVAGLTGGMKIGHLPVFRKYIKTSQKVRIPLKDWHPERISEWTQQPGKSKDT